MLQKLLHYLNPLTLFRKSSAEDKPNINLRMMHGINRISIFMFLIALVLVCVKVFGN